MARFFKDGCVNCLSAYRVERIRAYEFPRGMEFFMRIMGALRYVCHSGKKVDNLEIKCFDNL